MDRTVSCDSVWDSLSEYADGLASPSVSTTVENHVAICESCARDLAFMHQTATVLSTVPEVAPPVGLREAIFAATVEKRAWYERLGWSGSRAGFGFRQLAYAGACAAAGVIVAFVVVANERSKAPDTMSPGSTQAALLDRMLPAEKKIPAPEIQRNLPQQHNNVIAGVPRMPETNAGSTDKGRSRTANVEAKFFLPDPAGDPKSGSLSPRRPISIKPFQPADPGRRKPLREPSAATENVGPTMETANMVTAVMPDPEMGPMIKEPIAGSGNAATAPTATSEATHREYHIQLTNSGVPVNAGAIASLADLRDSLKKNQSFKAPIIPLVRSNDRKEVKLDLLKGKF